MNLRLYGHEQLQRDWYPSVTDRKQAMVARDLMFGFMRQFKKTGISAPQLGLPINMAAITLLDGTMRELINPRITTMSGMELLAEEGCVSCPPGNNRCLVARVQVVSVSVNTINQLGWKVDETYRGLEARLVQHEVDHLSGVFFFDRVATPERRKITEQFDEWRKMRKISDLTVSTREK